MGELIIRPEIKESAYWSNMTEDDYRKDVESISYEIREESSIYEQSKRKYKNPKVGNIWLVKFPKLEKYKKKNHIEIKNWKEIDLKEKSFVRLSMPIKIEKEQLVFKITKVSKEEVKYYASKITDILNMDNLNKLRKGENIYK